MYVYHTLRAGGVLQNVIVCFASPSCGLQEPRNSLMKLEKGTEEHVVVVTQITKLGQESPPTR